MYSSVASVFGSSGQSNHAAANAFMDSLAHYRRATGLHALSVSWGAWSEVGAAAARNVDKRVSAHGLDVITPRQGLEWLGALMGRRSAHVVVTPVRWETFLERSGSGVRPYFARFASGKSPERAQASANAPGPLARITDQLENASADQRQDLLLSFVAEHVARVIGASAVGDINPRQPLNELGLDSLMAVELRNRLGSGLGLARSLPATLVFDHPTLQALATYLDHEVLGYAPATQVATVPTADAVGAIDDMSDEEIEQLFAKKTGGA
jgi:acyl carrier protein